MNDKSVGTPGSKIRFSASWKHATNRTENRTWFYTCDFEVTTLARQKLHRVAATKIACVNGPLDSTYTTLNQLGAGAGYQRMNARFK